MAEHESYSLSMAQGDDMLFDDVLSDTQEDPVNPSHYKQHPSGIECIEITQHMNFCLGNAFKYIWRAPYTDKTVQDLQKAKWYIDQEIHRLSAKSKSSSI